MCGHPRNTLKSHNDMSKYVDRKCGTYFMSAENMPQTYLTDNNPGGQFVNVSYYKANA